MTEQNPNDAPSVSEPASPVAPPVVRQKRRWVMPVIMAGAVVVALVVGGVGGFAIAKVTGPGGRPAVVQVFPGGSDGPGAQNRPEMPQGPHGDERPDRSPGDGESSDSDEG